MSRSTHVDMSRSTTATVRRNFERVHLRRTDQAGYGARVLQLSGLGQGPPASFASTLKVQRSAVGSGSGRPGRVWPMSQLGRELPFSLRVVAAKRRTLRMHILQHHNSLIYDTIARFIHLEILDLRNSDPATPPRTTLPIGPFRHACAAIEEKVRLAAGANKRGGQSPL